MPRLALLSLAVASACGDARARADAGEPARPLDCAALVGGAQTAPSTADLALCALVVASSCHGFTPGSRDFWMESIEERDVRCLASAGGDCAAVDECLGLVTTTATCDSMEESCDGDRAIHCGPDGTTVEDCPNSIWNAPAPTCIVDGDGHSRCGAQGICTENAVSCVGDFLLLCEEVASTGMWTASGDCARRGWSCAVEEDGFARCSDGTSDFCMLEIYTAECDGDVVTICPAEFLISTECTRIPGGYCNVGDPQCRVADECDTNDATCADSRTLQFCALGAARAVDCVALGFAGCVDQELRPGSGGLYGPHCSDDLPP